MIQTALRPHDVLVVLQMALSGPTTSTVSLARHLKISQGEIVKSLQRSRYAGLMSEIQRGNVHKAALLDFIRYGLPYAFPVQPGPEVIGMQTGLIPELAEVLGIVSVGRVWVWTWNNEKANARGAAIRPLHPNVPDACYPFGSALHRLLASLDLVRAGGVREKQLAFEYIEKVLKQ